MVEKSEPSMKSVLSEEKEGDGFETQKVYGVSRGPPED